MSKINVSLTTISSRLKNVHRVVDSILKQKTDGKFSFQVNLYISSEPYMLDEGVRALSPELIELEERDNFKVHIVENIGSYRKFYFSLKSHFDGRNPVDFLVTCDDDTIYPNWWLSTLYEKCVQLDCCVAFRGRQIVYEKGERLNYKKWLHGDDSLKQKRFQNLGTGKDGIIYKPSFFHPGVNDLEDVLKYVGHADDLWLKAHTAMNFVPTVILEPDLSKAFPETDASSKISLYHKFNRAGGNDQAMSALQNFIRHRYRVDINDFFSFNLRGNTSLFKLIES